MNEVTTERLRLRELTQADAAFIIELLNDPAFLLNIGDRRVRTLADARRYIEEGPRAMYQRSGVGLALAELKDTGESVGLCGLLVREALPDPDLGFAMLPRFRRRGLAREAAIATLEQARARGLAKVLAVTSAGNVGSRRILFSLGFEREGTVRLTGDGEELDMLVWQREHNEARQSTDRWGADRSWRDIERLLRDEIESLHRVLVDWFGGVLCEPDFGSAFTSRFHQRFELVPPSGGALTLERFAAAVYQRHGSNPQFRVAIREVELKYVRGDLALVSYEEWQRSALASSPGNNARVASALFQCCAPLQWLSIHETALPEAVVSTGDFGF